jgi:hypothetical protein
MAVPVSWAARFHRAPTDLLDACTNISIGTAMMASFAAECSPPRRHAGYGRRSKRPSRHKLEAERACVLQGFDREVGVRGFTQILDEIRRLPVPDPDADLPPERSNVFDADGPTARPQLPLELPVSGAAPGPTPPGPPRSSPPRPGPPFTPPPGSGTPRASAPPPSPPAPTERPTAGAAGRQASPPAPRTPRPALPRRPTAAGPARP